MVKAAIINLLRRMGYELVPSARVMPRDIGGHLGTLLALMNITCVIDVGANEGQYRDFLRTAAAYNGLVLSFEPVAKLAQSLQERAAHDPNWVVFPYALGGANEARTFNVMQATTLSSFLPPDNSEIALFADNNVVDHTEQVQMRTLDSVLAELRAKRDLGDRLFLKMDTQGYDLEVIRGATETLGKVAAMQTELSFQKLYAGMPGYVEVLQTLDSRGFELSGMFPVNQDTNLRLIESDCVMVNRALLPRKPARLMWTNDV